MSRILFPGGQPMSTAPRDGTTVELFAEDIGIVPMFWDPNGFNPLVSKTPGIWKLVGGGMTWTEDDPDGAPTQWRPQGTGA